MDSDISFMKKSSDEFMKKSLRIGLVENDLEFRETTEVKLQSISSVSKIYAWSSAEEYLREKKSSCS